MPRPENLIPGAGAGDDGIEPRRLKSGWRTRNPPPEVIEPHQREIERDVLMVETIERAAALDALIVTRITEFLEARGWDMKGNGRQGRRMRVEVEHLGRAVDRLAKRAEQLRRARLDVAMAQRAGIVDLATHYAQLAEEEQRTIEADSVRAVDDEPSEHGEADGESTEDAAGDQHRVAESAVAASRDRDREVAGEDRHNESEDQSDRDRVDRVESVRVDQTDRLHGGQA